MAESVDDRRDLRVGEPHLFQQRGGFDGEESAVVGRQADRGVALVDHLEQLGQPVVVVAGDLGERVPVVHPPGDVVPDPLAQSVVVVACVVDRQQAPVLGVEDEEQPVEEYQRGLPDLGEAGAGCVGQRLYQVGKDTLEYYAGEVLGDLLLVTPALGYRLLEERGRRARPEGERLPPEEQEEGPQGVVIVAVEYGLEIGLVVAAGPGPGAVIVKAPEASVRQDTPADAPVGGDLSGREVAQDLAVGRARLDSVRPVPGVERQAEALALLNDGGVPVAVGRVRPAGGAGLRLGVGEQQVVGDVLVTVRALLGQVVRPPKQLEHRAG